MPVKFKEYERYDDIRPFISFKDSLLYAAQNHPDMDAYRYKIGDNIISVTFSDLVSQVKSLSASLAAFGFSGKHIAIVAENSYKWVLSFQTLMCGNFVAVPIDGSLPFNEICNILEFSDSEVVLVSKSQEEKFKAASKNGSLPFIKK